MEIIYKKIDDIKPYVNNPRFNDDAVQYVANSIKEFGFKVPIILDKNNEIVAGHTRYKASLELGLKEVPCIVADDLTEEQIKAFRLVDNKVAEMSVWDLKELKEELEQLDDFDMSLFGLDDEIENVIDILDKEGLNKTPDGIKEKFSVTFSSSISRIEILKDYLIANSKQDLEDIFIEVIKEMNDGDSK